MQEKVLNPHAALAASVIAKSPITKQAWFLLSPSLPALDKSLISAALLPSVISSKEFRSQRADQGLCCRTQTRRSFAILFRDLRINCPAWSAKWGCRLKAAEQYKCLRTHGSWGAGGEVMEAQRRGALWCHSPGAWGGRAKDNHQHIKLSQEFLPWVRKKGSRYTVMHFTDITAAQNSHRTLGMQARGAVPLPRDSRQGGLQGWQDSSDVEKLPSQGVGWGMKLLPWGTKVLTALQEIWQELFGGFEHPWDGLRGWSIHTARGDWGVTTEGSHSHELCIALLAQVHLLSAWQQLNYLLNTDVWGWPDMAPSFWTA